MTGLRWFSDLAGTMRDTFRIGARQILDASSLTATRTHTLPNTSGTIAIRNGQLGGTDAAVDVRGLRETAGPTLLTIGDVSDGQYLKRNGTGLVGGTPAPTAHASTHQPGGSDTLAVDAAAGTGSLRTLGTGGTQATAGNDTRLSNARTPTAHATTHQPGGADAMAVDAAAGTGSLRTLGTGALQAMPGNTTVGGTGSLVYSNTSVPAGNTIANQSGSDVAFTSSYTIPANSLTVGAVIRVRCWGVYSTSVIAPMITLKLKLGSITMVSSGAISGVASVTNAGWWGLADLTVQSLGSTGSIEAQGYGVLSTAATTGLSVNATNTAPVTIDTTVDEMVTVTVQWSASSASNSITLRELPINIEGVVVNPQTGLLWNTVSGTSQQAAINNGYIANNSSLVTITLPVIAAVGDRVPIIGFGSGGWRLAQNSGQKVHFLVLDTTTGTGGRLDSTTRYDCIDVICVVADTDWVVRSSIGNITVT